MALQVSVNAGIETPRQAAGIAQTPDPAYLPPDDPFAHILPLADRSTCAGV